MNAAVFRAARAYLRRCREMENAGRFPSDRQLIRETAWDMPRKHGFCKWCHGPLEGRKHRHPECAIVETAARGRMWMVNDQYQLVVPIADCEICGKREDMELDHRVPIALGIRSRNWRWIARVFWVGNLRWLCHACHARKTGEDRRIMNTPDSLRRAAEREKKFRLTCG